MATTLKTLVLKTATVASVKLATPADRIGLGQVVATYPADVQSERSGHLPPNTNAMRMHREEPATRLPRGRDIPGSSAHRWPDSFSKTSKRPLSRASSPAVSCVSERIGDCQSSDRRDYKATASTRETTPIAAAAK